MITQEIDQYETNLEKYLQNINDEVEKCVLSFENRDFAFFKGSLPNINTLLEYRQERESFLSNIEENSIVPKPDMYYEKIINDILSFDQVLSSGNSFLAGFYTKEISRIERIRKNVLQYSQCNPSIITEKGFFPYIESLTKLHSEFSKSLFRISSTNNVSNDPDDLSYVIGSLVVDRKKCQYIDSIIIMSKRIAYSRRKDIIIESLERAESDLISSGLNKPPKVPYCLSESSQIDDSLTNLANFFGIFSDINENDGQSFIFSCERVFTQFWEKIHTDEKVLESVSEPKGKLNENPNVVADEILLSQVPIDERFKASWNLITKDNLEHVLFHVKDQMANYDQNVNGSKYYYGGLLRRREPLSKDKIGIWFKLRLLKARYIYKLILSYFNYFEAIKQNLTGLKYSLNSNHKNYGFLEVFNKNQDIMFSTSISHANNIQNFILTIASHYTSIAEAKNIEARESREKIIDCSQIIEDLLVLEHRFLIEKCKVIESLYEIAINTGDKTCFRIINEIVDQRPLIRINLFNSYDAPYNLAIDSMKFKADLYRLILNNCILHEKHVQSCLPESISLFERSFDTSDIFIRGMFPSSLPVSPFDFFASISKIPCLDTIFHAIASEFCECIDLNSYRFFEYIEFFIMKTLLGEIKRVSQNGGFPYSIASYPFYCDISASPYSLLSSPYLTEINQVFNLIDSIPKSRRYRFSNNYLYILRVCWELQDLILDSDILQSVYLDQGSISGVADPRIYLSPFREMARSDMIDMNDALSSGKILHFALIDYDQAEFDFSNPTSLKKFISSSDFSFIQRLFHFQKMHVFIMETAVRYNQLFLDNEIIMEHFGFTDSDSVDVFLTQAANEDSSGASTFVRSFLSSTLFLDSQYLIENNKKAHSKREWCFLNIKSTKLQTRLVLNAQVKQKTLSEIDLYQNYVRDIVEAFSASSYRVEMSYICRFERHLLLMNTFSDAFIVDSTKITLVNEAGRVQNHFVVPSWIDVLSLVRTAPIPRQAAILKTVLSHVCYLCQILYLIRFECGINQSKDVSLLSLLKGSFKMETSVPQKLLNELGRLPGGNEFDVCSKYLEDKFSFLLKRMELAVLSSYEYSFVSITGIDSSLRSYMLSFYGLIKNPPCSYSGFINIERYVPLWNQMFMCNTCEQNRSETIRQLAIVDQRVENSLSLRRIHSILESYQALTDSIDFMSLALKHIRIKFAYMCLLDGKPYRTLNNPFSEVRDESFSYGITSWNGGIVPKSSKSLIPKEDTPISHNYETIPEDKILNSQIETAKYECNRIILHHQVDITKHISESIHGMLSHGVKSHGEIKKPNIDSLIYGDKPSNVDVFFYNQNDYSIYFVIEMVSKFLNQFIIDGVITDETLTNFSYVLSELLNIYEKDSISQSHLTWSKIIGFWMNLIRNNHNNDSVLDFFGETIKKRYDNQLLYELPRRLSDKYLIIKSLEALTEQRKKDIVFEDTISESQIHNEFSLLINDLNKQKRVFVSKYVLTRKSVFDSVLQKILRAKKVKLEPSSASFCHSEETRQDRTSEMNDEISAFKNDIRKMRIIRCMSNIATRRFFTKRMQSYEIDRKFESSRLWESKHDFEVLQSSMQAQLQNAYRSLTDAEINIEKTKHLIESEKKSTIQLVHWKAMNSKRETQLEKEIKALENIENTNIGELLEKIERSTSILNRLTEETSFIDEVAERTIKTPMKEAENIRNRITSSRLQRQSVLRSHTASRAESGMEISSSLINSYIEENEQIKSRNLSLKQEIRSLEIAQGALPRDVITVMSDVTSSPRMNQTFKSSNRSKSRQITKPNTSNTPRRADIIKTGSRLGFL